MEQGVRRRNANAQSGSGAIAALAGEPDPTRKPTLTPQEPALDAGSSEAPDPRLPKPRVVGSNPIARSS